MTEGENGVVALSIPARAEYIVLSRLALTGLSRVRALDAEVLADLKLAITEACSNAIRHGYGETHRGVVEITYAVAEDKVEVEVSDTGAGFDATGGDPTDAELDEGGLGIAIIRAVVDDLSIESNGDGSRLRFVKYLT